MGNASHQHITPRGYLNAWAADGLIDAHPASSAAPPRRISVRDAGVRSHFYSVQRDDGTYNTSVEVDLSRFESQAIPALRDIDGHWPLTGADRVVVSEFVALQMARGPHWRTWITDLGTSSLANMKASGEYAVLTEQAWSVVERVNLGDAGMIEIMNEQISRIATMVGAMHWTLVTFKKDALISSDHPVSAISVDAFRGTVQAQAAPRGGLLRTLEIRVPVSPRQALVMTWLPTPDRRLDRAWAGHADNINFGIRSHADVHWFTAPEQQITIFDKVYPTFTTVFGPAFTPQQLQQSTRRAHAQRLIGEMIEGAHAGKIPLVEVK